MVRVYIMIILEDGEKSNPHKTIGHREPGVAILRKKELRPTSYRAGDEARGLGARWASPKRLVIANQCSHWCGDPPDREEMSGIVQSG